MDDKKLQFLQIGNIVAVISTIIINGLANILPIGGKYTWELSDNIPNLFVPAGITFGIWGIIYILTILFSSYLAKDLFKKEKTTKPFLEKISFLFILACLANIIWIFLWHYEQVVLSLLLTLLLFFSLLFIYIRLKIGIDKIPLKEKLFIHLPISVYLGWASVATVANITAVLVTLGWGDIAVSEQILWTILVLIVITIITILMIIKRRDYAYIAVIIWALLGIYLKRISVDPIYGIQSQIAYTAAIAILVIIIFAFLERFILNNTKKLNI